MTRSTCEILAYLLRQNGHHRRMTHRFPPILRALKTMLLPGFTGGPSGGLVGGVAVPPAPRHQHRWLDTHR